jgi:hypothetical protein
MNSFAVMWFRHVITFSCLFVVVISGFCIYVYDSVNLLMITSCISMVLLGKMIILILSWSALMASTRFVN